MCPTAVFWAYREFLAHKKVRVKWDREVCGRLLTLEECTNPVGGTSDRFPGNSGQGTSGEKNS